MVLMKLKMDENEIVFKMVSGLNLLFEYEFYWNFAMMKVVILKVIFVNEIFDKINDQLLRNVDEFSLWS